MREKTRREAILLSLQTAAYAAASGKGLSFSAEMPDDSQWPSLKSIGARFGCPVGTATPYQMLQDAAIAQIVTMEFNLLTASGMKWVAIHPDPDRYDFTEGDWNVHFAEEHGMQIHGHNLCWNNPAGNPAWLQSVLNRNNAREILTSHITTVMKRYQGRVASWDVVNEPVVSWPVKTGGLYPGIWLQTLGPEYLDIAFHAAAEADPKALRIMNVHALEQDTPENELARTRVIEWLKELLSRGVPIQAVGIESHLDAARPLADAAMRKFLATIREMGLRVLVTELDVKESRATGNSHDWDVTIADYYSNYLAEVLSTVQPQSIIFWSLTDRWDGKDKVQGLLQNNLSPRLSLLSAAQALEKGPSHG
jgi:endo-1,4-beta-xylanase